MDGTTATYNGSYTTMKMTALSYAQTASNIGIALDGSTPFSVDAWLHFNGLCSESSILSKEGVFNFGIIGDDIVLEITGYPPVQSDPSQTTLDDETWHYVCATFDGFNVRLYIDGQFNYGQSISGTGSSNGNPFLIGSDLQAHVWAVRVYNTALSAETVSDYMFGDPDPSSVVAYFDFSQNPPVDLGSGHLPIQLQAGATMVTETPALALEGNAYAQPFDDEEYVNPGGYQVDPYTVQAWVYISSTDVLGQAIFVNSDLESDTGMALYLEYDDMPGGFYVVSQRGANVDSNALTSNGVVQTNTWTNVATTFDGTTLSIYIGGTLDNSGPFGPIPLIRDVSDLAIGAAFSYAEPHQVMSLQGYIARVDVWERALSAAEIAQYMSAAPDVQSPGLDAVYDFTAFPAVNQVNGHAIGLAASAVESQMNMAVAASTSTPSIAKTRQSGRASTRRATSRSSQRREDALLQESRNSLDFTDFLSEHGHLLEQAMETDAAAFEGSPGDQERIRAAWQDTIERMRDDPASLPFTVTTHREGDEYVLVCHTRQGSYVGYRAAAADVDPCTLWVVGLVFIVIGGILDAFVGVRPKLTQRATNFIVNRVLVAPRIRALFAVGSSVSATSIFLMGKEMYNLGVLGEMLKLILDLSFWALARIAVRLILKLAGVGAADVIVSLVATAATFAQAYLQRPSTCDPLPTVGLAAIKFNYDPTALAIDALSIRKNYTATVAVPEWTLGKTNPQDSPAAYSIAAVSGKTISIQARFTISSNTTTATTTATTAQIKADGGDILGAIDPVTINFKNGVSDPQFVTLQLPHHQIGTSGVQRQDIQWTWSYNVGAGWTQIGITSHRIYIVLSTPASPWTQSSSLGNTQLPWTDALDFACAWANGQTSVLGAATAVTQKVNGSINLTYDLASGASAYTQAVGNQRGFLCTDFLAFLNFGTGKGPTVNCTDCATIVTTFANLVGCNLTESTMYSALAFQCNEIIAIGGTNWAYPFPPYNNFSYHEVAWTGALSFTDNIFDACLQVDSSDNPWDWSNPATHTPELPTNMVFTTQGISPSLPIPTPFTDQSYRERLAQNNAQGIGRCVPRGPMPYTQSGRRMVI